MQVYHHGLDLQSPTSLPLLQEAFALLFWTMLHAPRLIPALALGRLQGSCFLSIVFSSYALLAPEGLVHHLGWTHGVFVPLMHTGF